MEGKGTKVQEEGTKVLKTNRMELMLEFSSFTIFEEGVRFIRGTMMYLIYWVFLELKYKKARLSLLGEMTDNEHISSFSPKNIKCWIKHFKYLSLS